MLIKLMLFCLIYALKCIYMNLSEFYLLYHTYGTNISIYFRILLF